VPIDELYRARDIFRATFQRRSSGFTLK
jgi:hypothetical protein